jgi:hypothetical protein
MISFVQHHGIAYASRMALGIGTFGTFFALLDFWHCLSGIFGLVWFHLAFWVHEEVLMDDTTHTHRQTEFFLFRFGRAQQGFGVYIQVAFGAFTRYLWYLRLCHLDSRSLETIYGNMFILRICREYHLSHGTKVSMLLRSR